MRASTDCKSEGVILVPGPVGKRTWFVFFRHEFIWHTFTVRYDSMVWM